MRNHDAEKLIERAWDNGFTGQLGSRPDEYQLAVVDNSVSFTTETEEDQELRHLCLNCLLMDKAFIGALLGVSDPREHLCAMVCMSEREKVKYLTDIISTFTV